MLSGLLGQLAPHVRESLLFAPLLDLASAIVEQSGVRVHLDARQNTIIFMAAWMARGRGGPLSQVDERASYWQEEIDHVIKARGITDLAEYCEVDRPGRHTSLDRPQREAVCGSTSTTSAGSPRRGCSTSTTWWCARATWCAGAGSGPPTGR